MVLEKGSMVLEKGSMVLGKEEVFFGVKSKSARAMAVIRRCGCWGASAVGNVRMTRRESCVVEWDGDSLGSVSSGFLNCVTGNEHAHEMSSSLRGEQAAKDGFSFEFSWTVFQLINVMAEEAKSIWMGGLPGESGVDLRIVYSGHEEHHQVKLANGTRSSWTLEALKNEGVLEDFKERLRDVNSHCYFVSSIPATQLSGVSERARRSDSFESFSETYLNGDYAKWFGRLVLIWGLPKEECWSRLKRVYTTCHGEGELESACRTLLRSNIVGDPSSAWLALWKFCSKKVQQVVRASEIWAWLAENRIQRQFFEGDERIQIAIEEHTKMCLLGVRGKLIKPPVQRAVSKAIVDVIAQARDGQDLVLLGEPGAGKSAVLLQVTDLCVEKGWPVLAIRLDNLASGVSNDGFKTALNLPVPADVAIAHAAAGGPALVIIDQLDAVSAYSGRTSGLLDSVCSFIQELRGHRLRSPIHLMLACRNVDWRYDGRLRRLRQSSGNIDGEDDQVFKVEPLTDEEIRMLLNNNGLSLGSFTVAQKEQLLRRPQFLAVLLEARPSMEEVSTILTVKQLFDAYWEQKERELAINHPNQTGNPWVEILGQITHELSKTALTLVPQDSIWVEHSPLSVPERVLIATNPVVRGWMYSAGVLVKSDNRIRFGHETFFDYCFARFFDDQKESLFDYLNRSDQTLIQRGQVRQVLVYLRELDFEVYVKTVRELLFSDSIRDHLKHLISTVICEVTDPKLADWNLLIPLLNSAVKDFDAGIFNSVECQTFFGFSSSLSLFQMACQYGDFRRWLDEAGEKTVERLFRVLNKHQAKAQSEVWELIGPLVQSGKWENHLKWLAAHCCASDSRSTFEWLQDVLRMMLRNAKEKSQLDGRFHSLAEDLQKNQPGWLAEWIASIIQESRLTGTFCDYEILRHHLVDPGCIEPTAMAAPIEFVNHVLSALTLRFEQLKGSGLESWDVLDDYEPGSMNYVSADKRLFKGLVIALKSLISRGESVGREWMATARLSEHSSLRKLYGVVLCEDSNVFTSMAADFLLHDGSPFDVHDDRGGLVAISLLKIHFEKFSAKERGAIEMRVLNEFPKWQNRLWKPKGKEREPMCLGNDRGKLQMCLLEALPPSLRSELANRRLAEFQRKFNREPSSDKVRSKQAVPNSEVIKAWAPQRFLNAYNQRSARRPSLGRSGEWDFDNPFGVAMENSARMNPEMFIRFLTVCDITTNKSFIGSIAQTATSVPLPSDIILLAIQELERWGDEYADRIISLFGKLDVSEYSESMLERFLRYVIEYPEPKLDTIKIGDREIGKHLEAVAINSVRGQAIGVLYRILCRDMGIIECVRDVLPVMMKEPNPALRAEAACLCCAISGADAERDFALNLFDILVGDSLPDIHVLSSRWPFEFMRVGLRRHWPRLKPTVQMMIESDSCEVRSKGAKLVTIARVIGQSSVAEFDYCLASEDSKVRKACAQVLSNIIDGDCCDEWLVDAFLTLADDEDIEVCRATGFGFHRRKAVDFGPLEIMLKRYVNTRAFLCGPSGLLDAISDSRSVLPSAVFDIVETFVARIGEPVESDSDRLHFHVDTVTEVLKRLYYDNRDGELRRRALELIDQLCHYGGINSEDIDK